MGSNDGIGATSAHGTLVGGARCDEAFLIPGLALLELDENCVVLTASSEAGRLLGRTIGELVGRSLHDFVHPDTLEQSVLTLCTVREGPLSCLQQYLRPDGAAVPVQFTAVWAPQHESVIAHLTDLSEAYGDREALVRARDHHEALIAHSTDLILVVDATGTLAEANPAAIELAGDHRGELAETFVRRTVHPDDVDTLLDRLAAVLARPGPSNPVTFRIAVEGGRWVTLEAVANNQLANPAVQGVVINARDVSLVAEFQERTRATLASLITALGRASEFRDPYTAGHQMQVADLSGRIARHLGLSSAECELIELGADIHDIGKIAIPAEILTRPGRLSPLEYEMIKTHCRIGHDILATVDLPWQIPDIVLHHHERLDGSGYPDKLAGGAISLPAKIVGVADVIDAMASHRPYRPALGIDAARAELQRGRGTQYDAAVVDAAFAVLSTPRKAQQKRPGAPARDFPEFG